MRSRERLQLLIEEVDRLADMLTSAVAPFPFGPDDLDRETLQLLADAFRQAARLGGNLRQCQPLVSIQDYEDACDEAACLRRAMYDVDGHRWCRTHALDTALGSAALTWTGRRRRRPQGVGD